jgi:hypothetical protein
VSWSPPYATPAELAGWLITADAVLEAVPLALAIESASRAIDKATGRQFGQVSAPEVRYYTPQRDPRSRVWYASFDDVQTVTGLVIEVDDDEVTEYQLTPRNSVAKGRPFTGIEYRHHHSPDSELTVTARWGWDAVPDAVKAATLMQAGRIYDRRENPGGSLIGKVVDDVNYRWSSTAAVELDADVLTSIAPFRRLWAAA